MLRRDQLGMGSRYTWHGSPDARCYNLRDIVSSNDFNNDLESSLTTSDGK